MKIERIELEHNKKITALFCLLLLIALAGIGACIALLGVNFEGIFEQIGRAMTAAAIVLLSLCAAVLCVLTVNQAVKLRRNMIFVTDENGICDYSRHIVLKPIEYGEIRSIEYKEFLSDDESDFRHLKINLKSNREYMKKLDVLQKISFVLGFCHIELHLFCAKTKVKSLAEKLKTNLEAYNRNIVGK